jgi:hypothetical protein
MKYVEYSNSWSEKDSGPEWWPTSFIPAILEAEIVGITVGGQPGKS